MITCPDCQATQKQVKAGFNRSGSQRYRCNVCMRRYTPQPTRFYGDDMRQQALRCYVDGASYRRIARHLGIDHVTVMNWVKAHADQLPPAQAGRRRIDFRDPGDADEQRDGAAMTLLIRSFRKWWQIPRAIGERSEHRQVTFLELFYDLVYVVLIAELTHALAAHIDLRHIAEFCFLFVITWWAWINGTAYHDLHGNNDIRTRIFTFLQMFTVAAMAVFAHDALGKTSTGFAIAYAGFQLILTYLWWRTGVHDPEHRPISRPYALAFLITTLLFVASVYVEPPHRFYLWIAAVIISVLLPLALLRLGRRSPAVQAQIARSMKATASLVERFGLFTIIVLGEVFVGVAQGVASYQDLNWHVFGISALGMIIAFGTWWLYFDFVSHRIPRNGMLWVYAHLPVTAGIAMVGAAIVNVVEHAAEPLPVDVRWFLVCAIGVVLASIALLIGSLRPRDDFDQLYRMGQIVIFLVAIVIFALGFTTLGTIPLLAAIAVLMLTPVALALIHWIRRIETSA